MQTICNKWQISNEEYATLDVMFGRLAHKQAWDLKRRNVNNNVSDDQEDFCQDIRIALLRAGSYYKRQTYIESSFDVLENLIKDPFTKAMIGELKHLWTNKTRHGANRQKFGDYQEVILDRLLKRYVPKTVRPLKSKSLVFDSKFITYCKQISWNEQKRMGKKITREKSWRCGLVSLSQFDYMSTKI
jgi:hypothetical protein